MWKKSNNPKVEELIKSVRDRQYNLTCLQPIKLEELNAKGKPKRLCAWCAETEIFHGNQKYCSNECSDNAMAFAYPQKENNLKILLIRQDLKCSTCQYDYRPFLEAMTAKDRKVLGIKEFDPEKLFWYHFKRLKSHVPADKKPEVDHVISLSKGGESLGNSNHQAICYTCHKAKTKIDNSGPRKKT